MITDSTLRRRGHRVRAGVRVRSALAAVLVVGLALVADAGILVLLLQRSLLQSATAAATQRAQDIAVTLPGTDPARLSRSLVSGPSELSVAQVIGPSGEVLGASPEVTGEPALDPVRPTPGEIVTARRVLPIGRGEGYVVASLGVATPQGERTVVVGQSLHPVAESVAAVAALLAAGFPILLLVVGAATYVLVGRSMRAVEEIRRRVAGITSRDLTERVPEPLGRDEVGRLAETMNQMLSRLQAGQATQRRFIADASHELRSPLSTLRSTVEVAAAHPETLTGDTGETLLAETRRLQRLVDDLVVLARADEGGTRRLVEEVDLDDLAVAERARVRSGTVLRVTGDVTPVRVHGDRHQLAQVLRNLVDNAVRHARAGIAIELRVETGRGTGHAVLSVSDDGPGVAPGDRRRVFDRFVRLDEHRSRDVGGSGLGLAIVAELVTAHDGSVEVTDAAGGGARFLVRLPLPGPP